MTIVGPAAPITGPAVQAPLHSLIATVGATDDTGRWEHGVEWCPEDCFTVGVWKQGCYPTLLLGSGLFDGPHPEALNDPGADWPGGGVEKADRLDEAVGPDSYEPFIVESSVSCCYQGFPARDFEARAQRQLEAGLSNATENEFWTGAMVPTNPNLNGSGVVIATDVTPLVGLALLEQYLADQSASRGVIHLPVLIATLLADGQVLRDEGPRLITRSRGDLVVSGNGYPGSGPGGVAPPDGYMYIYATGPMQVRVGPVRIVPDNLSEALDRQTNNVEYRAERSVAPIFDTCNTPAAVLVRYSDDLAS